MKIALFGGSGRTGLPFIQQALDDGHHVAALVRNPAKINITHPNLTLIQGDVKDAAAVAKTVEGAEVVVSALGQVAGQDKDIMTVAARHIVAAMKQHGVRRVVTLTGAGVRAPGDRPKPIDRIMGVMLRTFARDVLLDANAHVETFKDSGLDWTVVRGPMLTEGGLTRSYKVGTIGDDLGIRVSRADVAHLMLKLAVEGGWSQRMPVIG